MDNRVREGSGELVSPAVISDPIRAALRAERKRQKLSQTAVGQRMGHATYGSVHAWESGAAEPKLSSLHAWAHALGLQLALLPLDDGDGGT